ncbi:MAG TPA: site-specific DNA-methyltransferase [Candidatus Sulfotelmatobacter sp.]|nr:site-specific DNA-methyltransferase [Candidatus Sulfotelmatobacter sp.]
MKPNKPVKAFKHKEAKRAHIPSAEEAGYESANPKVKEAGLVELPLNPIISRGQDPELFWMHKYGTDEKLTKQLDELQAKLKAGDVAAARVAFENLRDVIAHRYEMPQDEAFQVDIRSIYRHEHIAPETLIKGLYRIVVEKAADQNELFAVNELFGNAIGHEELDKVSDYYTHSDGWTNRLIQGDSLLVMTSLLEREGMVGQVQSIYIDPPYGIKYGSNWQIKLNNRTVKDNDDESLSGEPEQVKAFRDTWELGINSYLNYLRERLLVARELLHESGSCFVQISDENVHLVRNLMDEVFGSENFVAQINFKTRMPLESGTLESVFDYVLWYSKDKEHLKYRNLFIDKNFGKGSEFIYCDTKDGGYRKLTSEEIDNFEVTAKKEKIFKRSDLASSGYTPSCTFPIEFESRTFQTTGGKSWRTNKTGIEKLKEQNRLFVRGAKLYFKMYLEDFPFTSMINSWQDTIEFSGRYYVVQTTTTVVERCLLMTTDPGDLVLDPTCGSGTTAFVAEQWGRRWITIDTSRIAISIAKSRLMTSVFPYYQLYDQQSGDLRQGFIYKKVPHITLGSIANNEPPEQETIYDQPSEDKKRLRVAGPFTVETLQSYEPISPEELARQRTEDKELGNFEDLIFAHLKSAGVKTGIKEENAVFVRIERLADSSLHAEGWYPTTAGEKKAYLHIGPKFGTVSKQAVTEAIKACRDRRDGDWLLILGFSFESGLHEVTRSFGNFQVSLVRMHDDLLQVGLLKKDKKAASFVTIGEPDIKLHTQGDQATVEIAGLDIYDPIKDEVKSRDVNDIAYWMVDDNYDGSNFVVRQVFFCGGDKDEFEEWKKGLSDIAKAATKRRAEQTLKVEIDEEAFSRIYGHKSHPFPVKRGQKIAVRVISQFGEETTKILEVPR